MSRVGEKLEFVENFCIPAIAEQREKGFSTVRHPVSGEILEVERNDKLGFVVVYTKSDGVVYRVNFKPR